MGFIWIYEPAKRTAGQTFLHCIGSCLSTYCSSKNLPIREINSLMQRTPTPRLSTVLCLNQTFLSKCVESTQEENLIVTSVSMKGVKKKTTYFYHCVAKLAVVIYSAADLACSRLSVGRNNRNCGLYEKIERRLG